MLLTGVAVGLITGSPMSCGLSTTMRNPSRDMMIETAPNASRVVRHPKLSVMKAAIKGDTPPEMFAEALSKLQKVPNWSGENQWRSTFAQDGHPTPWAKPLQNQRTENMSTESVERPKTIVARPEKNKPEPKRSREDSWSERMPPTNFDIA